MFLLFAEPVIKPGGYSFFILPTFNCFCILLLLCGMSPKSSIHNGVIPTAMISKEQDLDGLDHLDRSVSEDSSQPAFPLTNRRLANPSPLGLFAYATSLMLISLFGVGSRGVTTPNIIFGPMIFFGGICQYISGLMEYICGNTVSIAATYRRQIALRSCFG